jgi:hypothetical protein
LLTSFNRSFACGELPAVGSFACSNPFYFLFLDKKKVNKEKSRLQIILGQLLFSLPTQYNSLRLVPLGFAQTVLLT